MAVHDGTSLLHGLKRLPDTRHIPTIAAHSAQAAESAHQGRIAGALDVIEEPLTRAKVDDALGRLHTFIDRKDRSLLVVAGEQDGSTRGIAERFDGADDLDVEMVSTVELATEALGGGTYDCVVVDAQLPDNGAFDVLKLIRGRKAMRATPVVVTGGAELSKRDQVRLRRYAESLTLTQPRTQGRLFDQLALFLHRQDMDLPLDLREDGALSADGEQMFLGKRILIVDDDVRNVFALTSALEQHGIDVLYADNGESGLETLRREPEIDLVLMDVMMPGMDGYTAMREIRKMPSFRDLPVIALTAKAMPGDRDNSLTAGASDYVTKPVDVEQLLSVFRTWLS
jgi:CheY-like chemotaxis protein